MELGLRNRACVITGASSGIGAATAASLAAEGASLLLVGRRESPLQEIAERCRQTGARAELQICDVTGESAAEELLSACLRSFDRIDAVVNNAGTSVVRALEELTDAEYEEQWRLNVMAPMRLMRAAAPVMAQRGWGRIVNVSSSSGKRPSQTNVAYSVTKAAELSLSRAFADFYGPRGVLINAVAPGPVASELWVGSGGLADQTARAKGITRDEVLQATGGRTPLGRMGTECEVAAVITFLCSEAASNVLGAAWSVDGGSVPGII